MPCQLWLPKGRFRFESIHDGSCTGPFFYFIFCAALPWASCPVAFWVAATAHCRSSRSCAAPSSYYAVGADRRVALFFLCVEGAYRRHTAGKVNGQQMPQAACGARDYEVTKKQFVPVQQPAVQSLHRPFRRPCPCWKRPVPQSLHRLSRRLCLQLPVPHSLHRRSSKCPWLRAVVEPQSLHWACSWAAYGARARTSWASFRSSSPRRSPCRRPCVLAVAVAVAHAAVLDQSLHRLCFRRAAPVLAARSPCLPQSMRPCTGPYCARTRTSWPR
jgi:hypothetical protein